MLRRKMKRVGTGIAPVRGGPSNAAPFDVEAATGGAAGHPSGL